MKLNNTITKTVLLLVLALISIGQVSALNLQTYWDNNEDTTQIDPGQQGTYYIDAIPNSWAQTLDVNVTLYDETGNLVQKGVIYEENNIDADGFYYSPELHITQQDYEYSGDYFLDIKVTQNNDDGTQTIRSNQLYLDVTGERLLNADFEFSPQNPTDEDTITFTSTSEVEGNTIESYEWSANGQDFGTGQEAQQQFQEGTHDVTLTITDSAGRTDSETKTITVQGTQPPQQGPTADFEFSPENPEENEDVTFTSTSSEGSSQIEFHQWSVDGQLTRVGNPATLTFDEPGTYDVELRVIDENKLEDTITKKITVEESQPEKGPNADFEFSPQNPEENEDVTFTSTSTEGSSPIESYTWTIDSNKESTQNQFTKSFTPGTYNVELTVTDQNGLQDSQTKTVTVQEKEVGPTASFEFSPENPEVGQSVQFTSTSSEGSSQITNWDWNIDGRQIRGEQVQNTFNQAGTYTAELTVTDENNLQDTTRHDVTVKEPAPTQELELTELGANNNVVQTKKQHFTGKVVDQNNEPVEEAHVTFRVEHPETEYETCTTNFKGYCNINPTINLEPGFYDVTATATKQGYEPDNTRNLQQTFQVWEQRYTIENLETYEDEFQTKNDTFYRANPVYASFNIVDDFTGEEVNPPTDLITDVKLKVNNVGEGEFDPIDVLTQGESLQRVENEGAFTYKLPEIPVTDNFLGDGKVFAFAFNFTDDTAGQGSKNVTILNNPVQFNQPNNIELEEGQTERVDFKQYLEDVETPKESIELTFNTDTIQITDEGQNEFSFTAPQDSEGTYNADVEANDTDGSTTQQSFTITVLPEPTGPTASFEFSPENPEENEEVTFTSTSNEGSSPITSTEWIINDESFTGQEVQTIFDEAGTYTAEITVTDQNGLQDTTTRTVNVQEQVLPPQASFEFSPQNPEVGEEVTFTSTSTDPQGQTLSHAWDLDGDGIVDEEGQTTTFTYDQDGTYNVKLNVENQDGLQSETTKQLTVKPVPQNQKPNADFEFSPENPEVNQDIQFTSTSTDSDGQITNWRWFIDGTQVSTNEAFTTSFDQARDHTIRLVVTDNDGAQDEKIKTVTTTPEPVGPTASFEFSPENPEENEDVTFTSTSSEGSTSIKTSEWTINGETLTGQQVTKAFNKEGTYNAQLTVTDQNDLQDTTTRTVTVQPEPESPTVTVQGPEETRRTTPTEFNATFNDPDGTVQEIQWQVNGETIQQTSSPTSPNAVTTTFNEIGTYTVSATVTDNDGLTSSDSTTVNVEKLGKPTANLDIQPNRKEGQTVLLDGSKSTDANGEIVEYNWEVTQPDGTVLLTETTNTSSINPVFPQKGVHTVTLTVTDNMGLSDSVTKQTTIFKQGTNLQPRERDVSLGGWSVKGPQGLSEIKLGEPFTVTTGISNFGTERANNLRLSFKLPEFGYERTGQPFSANSESGQGRRLTATMYNIPPGVHPAVVEVNGDNVHRKKTLEVAVSE